MCPGKAASQVALHPRPALPPVLCGHRARTTDLSFWACPGSHSWLTLLDQMLWPLTSIPPCAMGETEVEALGGRLSAPLQAGGSPCQPPGQGPRGTRSQSAGPLTAQHTWPLTAGWSVFSPSLVTCLCECAVFFTLALCLCVNPCAESVSVILRTCLELSLPPCAPLTRGFLWPACMCPGSLLPCCTPRVCALLCWAHEAVCAGSRACQDPHEPRAVSPQSTAGGRSGASGRPVAPSVRTGAAVSAWRPRPRTEAGTAAGPCSTPRTVLMGCACKVSLQRAGPRVEALEPERPPAWPAGPQTCPPTCCRLTHASPRHPRYHPLPVIRVIVFLSLFPSTDKKTLSDPKSHRKSPFMAILFPLGGTPGFPWPVFSRGGVQGRARGRRVEGAPLQALWGSPRPTLHVAWSPSRSDRQTLS